MQSKKTILMLPSWYPTKDNPYQGSFFREQAITLQEKYNFIVLRITEKKELLIKYYIFKIFGLTKPKINYIQNDNGIQEYSLIIKIPKFIFWEDFKFKIESRAGRIRPGVGSLNLPYIQKCRASSIKILNKKNLLPKFDCVYSLTSQDMAILGKTFSNVFKVPHVTAEHAPFPWPGYTLKNDTVAAIESADAFLAISTDKVRQVMLQNIKINPCFVWNLCDETKFTINKTKNKIKTFLIVAANSIYKNYPLFIKVMTELKKIAEKDFKVIVAGYNANKQCVQNVKELEKMIYESSFYKNTELIESIPRDEMPLLFNRCDAFVMTSIQEGLPVSAIEASMSGLPVFSTRCGGVEDYIDDSMGKIVSITDYKGLAQACNDFLNEVTTYDSNHIREKAISIFGRKAFIKNMSEAFDFVMK